MKPGTNDPSFAPTATGTAEGVAHPSGTLVDMARSGATQRHTDQAAAAAEVAAQEALIAKVRKLLAMAERSPHPDEADAFSRKAAELIAAHRIEPSRLRADQGPLQVLDVAIGRGAYVRARLALLQAVAEAHSCRVVFGPGPEGTVAHVAGRVDDLRTVELLYTSLHAQASGRLAAGRRSTAAATQQWRRSFLFGFAAQVGQMLDEINRIAVADGTGPTAGVDPSVGALPALAALDDRVDAFVRERWRRVTPARPAARATAPGYLAGVEAAAAVDLGRTRLPGRAALGPGREAT